MTQPQVERKLNWKCRWLGHKWQPKMVVGWNIGTTHRCARCGKFTTGSFFNA